MYLINIKLDKKLKSLTADFEPVQIALENVKELINSIKVSFPENMLDGVVPNFSELPIVWQYNALHDVKFAELSLPAMSLVTVVFVVFIYQMVSGEMQPFIYFQF